MDNTPIHYCQCKWALFSKYECVQKCLYYKLNCFPLPAIALPIDAPSAAPCPDTAGPASDAIAPPTIEPTVEPTLLLPEAVPLSPDVISVNTQQHSYVGYKLLPVIHIKV
jgi:hypothetical protein